MADTKLSALGNAGILTGAEFVPVLRTAGSPALLTTTTAIAALGGGGGTAGALGQQSLSLRANFAAVVAKAPLIADYQFGTASAGGPGITTIATLTQLAQYFNAFEDFTELTSINSEIERFQTFNSTNHVLNANNLTLQASNPNSDWQCTAITQCAGFTAGAATPIANLGLPNTSAIQVGQMCAVQGGGNVGGVYYVTAMVANVSVTLAVLSGSAGSQVSTGLIFWLPIYGASLAAPYTAGGPSFTFNSLPAGVVNGMAWGVYDTPIGTTLNRSADYRVTGIAGNVVSINPPWGPGLANLSAGTIVWFLPVVTSGQIWSRLQLDVTNPQTFFAIQADLTLLGPIGTTRTAIGTNGELTLAQFSGLPNTVPFGAWPAFWFYSADDGNSATETSSASEVDFVEIQIGCTQDCAYMNTGDASYTGSATLMTKNDSGWGSFAAFGIAIAPPGTTFVGRNLYQAIFCNGVVYRFFNGTLFNVKQFQWTNQRLAQFSVGIACGGLTAALAANTIFPNNPAGFANIQAAVNEIKVWYQGAPGGG
jgi:hypothetical protein